MELQHAVSTGTSFQWLCIVSRQNRFTAAVTMFIHFNFPISQLTVFPKHVNLLTHRACWGVWKCDGPRLASRGGDQRRKEQRGPQQEFKTKRLADPREPARPQGVSEVKSMGKWCTGCAWKRCGSAMNYNSSLEAAPVWDFRKQHYFTLLVSFENLLSFVHTLLSNARQLLLYSENSSQL